MFFVCSIILVMKVLFKDPGRNAKNTVEIKMGKSVKVKKPSGGFV